MKKNILENDRRLWHYEFSVGQQLPISRYGKLIPFGEGFTFKSENIPHDVLCAYIPYKDDFTPADEAIQIEKGYNENTEGHKYISLMVFSSGFRELLVEEILSYNMQVIVDVPVDRSQKVLFVSNRYIKDNSIIERNLDDKILRQTIWEVQDIELRHILGKELYESLAVEVIRKNEDASYEIPEKYLDLLEVIRPFISYGVLTYISIPLTYKATNKGFAVSNDANASITEGSDLQYVMNYYKTKFDSYKERLAEEVGKSCSGFMEKDLGWSTGWYIQGNQKKRDKIDRVVNKY